MNKQREALQRALEALTEVTGWQWVGPMRVMDEVEDAIAAIREALAEPEPWTPDDMAYRPGGLSMDERKPLNPDQIMLLANQASGKYWGTEAHIVAIVRLVEKAHGIGEV